jgi:hypothetical protein
VCMMGRHRQWSGNSQYSKAVATTELGTYDESGLSWAILMEEGKRPAREEVWAGEGIRPGFNKRFL